MVVFLGDNCIELLPQVVVLRGMVVFFGEMLLFPPSHLPTPQSPPQVIVRDERFKDEKNKTTHSYIVQQLKF
jgi:hypothetical protein